MRLLTFLIGLAIIGLGVYGTYAHHNFWFVIPIIVGLWDVVITRPWKN